MGDLVKRLRDKFCCENGCNCDEAADRIEALEAEVARLTAGLSVWIDRAERAEARVAALENMGSELMAANLRAQATLTAERAGADALAEALRKVTVTPMWRDTGMPPSPHTTPDAREGCDD